MQSINLSIQGRQFDVEITKLVGEKMSLRIIDVAANEEVEDRETKQLVADTIRDHHREYMAYARQWFAPGNKDREMAEEIERIMNDG